MSTFISLVSRLKDYKPQVTASIISNILMTVFTVVSIPMIIPFFEILFDQTPAEIVPADKASKVDLLRNQFVLLLQNYDRETALLYVCLGIAGVMLLKNLFRYLAKYFINPVRMGIVADMRNDLYQKYTRLPIDFFSDEKKGELLTKIIADINEIEHSILRFLEAAFKDPLLIIGSIGFMLVVHPGLTLFVFVLMILSGVLIGTISRQLKKDSAKAQSTLGEITSTVEETITGMSVIKAYDVQSVWQRRFADLNDIYRRTMVKLLARKEMASPMSEFLGVTAVTVLLYYGSHLVFKQEIDPGVFFAFIFAFYNVIEPSKSLSNAYFNIQKGMAALDRVNAVMDSTVEENTALAEHNSATNQLRGLVEFDRVDFRYPGEQSYAIQDFNLTINEGESVALVGASGSGKSTITKLLLKFYQPSEGSIKIDGIDIKTIENGQLRKQIGWVTQEAFMFHGTVKDNILFGRSASQPALDLASKNAFAYDFIESQQYGFNTSVGERGSKFSGGEKQRISIARAMLENPQILILDEPTSALDPKAEKHVTDALQHAMQGRTSIVIAHRMSTIMNADKIVVLDGGHISGIGSHEELLMTNSIYQQYIELQGSK